MTSIWDAHLDADGDTSLNFVVCDWCCGTKGSQCDDRLYLYEGDSVCYTCLSEAPVVNTD
jgi:hypothetical protein